MLSCLSTDNSGKAAVPRQNATHASSNFQFSVAAFLGQNKGQKRPIVAKQMLQTSLWVYPSLKHVSTLSKPRILYMTYHHALQSKYSKPNIDEIGSAY